MSDTPVVWIGGARQTGKTTLVREGLGILAAGYATLDDLDTLGAAISDPAGFLEGLRRAGEPVIVDEAQMAPVLFPAIKASVDRDRRPGRFLLTGSANVLLLPRLSESLAGRMEILTLWPLAQSEVEGSEVRFIDRLFATETPMGWGFRTGPFARQDLFDRIVRGGYPEPRVRTDSRRSRWYESYVTAILQRDVRDLANIEGLTQMPRLLAALAARTSSLMNVADLSRSVGVPYSTLSRYLSLLEAAYLTVTIPAWSANLSTRLVKSPKVMLNDTGLTAHLLGLSANRLLDDPRHAGGLLESFVAMEISKEIAWSETRPALYHWRTAGRMEVDLLLEQREGSLVGIEVKVSGAVGASDFKGLRALETLTGSRFHRGVVLHAGDRVTPFGERLFAVPLSALWR